MPAMRQPFSGGAQRIARVVCDAQGYTRWMSIPAVIAIAGTGYGLIGLLVIIVLVLLIIRLL